MKKRIFVILLIVFGGIICVSANNNSQPTNYIPQENGGFLCLMVVVGNDTMPAFDLPTLYCYAPMKFKDKKQEEFYRRTVRDVKRVLPLSKYIKSVVEKTNSTLMELPNKASRDNYMKKFEKKIYQENEAEFKKLTLNQGKLLIRLVDRECNSTSYQLIKAYRGSFRAGFWQIFAKMFGASLKTDFGTTEEDKIIERIITLVEAGQI